MARKTKKEQVEEYLSKGYRFIGLYENDIFVTGLHGDTVVECIKKFDSCYNSTLTTIFDFKENIVYIGRENDNADARGYFNYSYYDKVSNEMVYNQDEVSIPVVKLKTSKITKDSHNGYINRLGKFYECGFENHSWLAKELFFTKTIEKPENIKERYDEDCLDEMGWVKISSKRIHFACQRLSDEQKRSIRDYINIIGDEQYEFMHHMYSNAEIEEIIKDY
jgi:hypothetical protein